MIKEEHIKAKIKLYERQKKGLDNDYDIEVKNLIIDKNGYIADIVFREKDYTEIYNNCKYKKEIIDNINKEENNEKSNRSK